MAQVRRPGADDDGLAPKDGTSGDRRYHGEDRDHHDRAAANA
jgi:hypothetical protein